MPPSTNRLLDEPIRAELFSLERLEQHAESLAAAQQVSAGKSRGRPLLPRVKANGRRLAEGYQDLSNAAREKLAITPAAEWLLDNFHVIEEQIREIIDDLPPGFYRELPKLADGHLEGFPRVYGVAWAFVAHTDSRFDREWLRRYVRAYQKGGPLQIGEIWALAISLRIILVENLRRITDRVLAGKFDRQEADVLADRLLTLDAKTDARSLLAPYENKTLSRAFAVQLVQRLRDQEGQGTPVLQWLDARLAEQKLNAEDIVRLEHQEQTAMNTTVRNVVTSMRLLTAMDWAEFFEEVSAIDEVFRSDGPAFAAMDFPTRDRYRHAVEELARGSELTEVEVGRRALQAAHEAGASIAHTTTEAARQSDPGYFLIGPGRRPFEKAIGFHATPRQAFRRLLLAKAVTTYLGGLALLTGFLVSFPLVAGIYLGVIPLRLSVLTLLGLLPASDIALAIMNHLVTRILGPRTLAKLDFQKGIPTEYKTLIAIPALLTSTREVEELVERLEIHFLSNSDEALRFALITDWNDASAEKMSGDDALLSVAREGIRRLNERYRTETPRFFLFHRRRQWNPSEGVWMGWERKRGKLHELNRLLRGDIHTSFIEAAAVPSGIQFVITLDADTHLPRGVAGRLVGAMAHPLNRPDWNPESSRVIRGYGIMQPRITPTLPAAGAGSRYQQAYSGPAGMDPYAFAVSDVYQDLFSEGSYVGKGIYDVDAFEKAMAGRVAENTLLSHDLFEGLFTRTALVTEIELFEEFPSHYEVALARSHRWTRGDWQLLPLLLQRKYSKVIPLLGQWKILDNLRRSLSTPAMFLILLVAWTGGRHTAELWTAFVMGAIATPPLLPVLIELLPRRLHISLSNHFRGVMADTRLALWHIALATVFLAHQAWMMTDAIARTLYRLTISHRRLLEWKTAALSRHLFDYERMAFYRRMMSAPLLAAAASALTVFFGAPGSWRIAVPFVIAWAGAPWLGRRLSLPLSEFRSADLSLENRKLFRRIARQTWRFFETFVTAEQHFLPPDNFQEIPKPIVAHRTSPTNIGLYLLSVTAAHELGWIGLGETVERLEATLATVGKLSRYRGHLYNWYDTHDLRALEPTYVSTVDSGNLAGHLWTLGAACRRYTTRRVQPAEIRTGFEDVLALLSDAVGSRTELGDTIRALQETLQALPLDPRRWRDSLTTFAEQANALLDRARKMAPVEATQWAELLRRQIQSHLRDGDPTEPPAPAFVRRLEAIAKTASILVEEMRFEFLCDPVKKIFSIGMQTGIQKLDSGFYDLLASEARLASFVAIAKGEVPALHWFHLSRSLIPVGGGAALVSWSGSMFEYLMPSLVMRPPEGSLLDQTCRRIVRRQIEYGEEKGVPWGVSESGYNAQDLEFTYQYSNFGVPGLGLKRGLSTDLLIAPYATALAAMVDPNEAANNFRHLAEVGARGRYGFYESLDYTPTHLPENQTVAVIQQYMAHHQGMSLISLANVLHDGVLRDYFHAEPRVQATELLLQERTPRDVPVAQVRMDESQSDVRSLAPAMVRRFDSPYDTVPRTHLLSNGRYSVMITAAGSGYSRWRDLAVTRWREDVTRDCWGTYIFLRDVAANKVWSAGFQPSGVEPDRYEVDFSEDRAEIIRQDGSLVTTLEVVVSPEDDAEIRRVTLQNMGMTTREIELTSYTEIVLASPAADAAHPAFSNLFVQTEYISEVNGLLCARRPRTPEEQAVWAAHVVATDHESDRAVEYESDRERFLGRGRNASAPLSVLNGEPLSNTAGDVLDPIVSLRRRVKLAPGESVRVSFTTLMATTREQALDLADKYHDLAMFDRTVTLAWTRAHIEQHHLGIAPGEAHLYQDLASRILYSHSGLRASSEVLQKNRKGAPGLWAHGISGDIPIMLLRIDEEDDRDIVRELLRAHEYWRLKNLAVDLVILNEKNVSYTQELQIMLENLVKEKQELLRQEAHKTDGDIFVLRSDRLSFDDRVLLLSAARVILLSRHGTLAQQMERLESATPAVEALPTQKIPTALHQNTPDDRPALEFFNGVGGFTEEGREYVVTLDSGQTTPAPWINVIANPAFGFQVSESGAGYTWAGNSRENQLTPWSNDPVSDPVSEAFYIRDEETDKVWTPTALPIRQPNARYTAHHGQGYSRFHHTSHGIATELLQWVPVKDPIKISRLRLTNTSRHTRSLSITAYAEWVLGPRRAPNAPFILTELDPVTGALFARNPWNHEFGTRVAFADLAGTQTSWTAHRTEFLGRNGSPEHPAALERALDLSGRVGAGLDPCAALQRSVRLQAGAHIEIVFLLGQADTREAAALLIQQYRLPNIGQTLQTVQEQWDDDLTVVQVKTPDRAMDLMVNRWLLYQTQSCRLWARAAFYQAGGAYGFRDQLQDVMALITSRPDLVREQILRAAARQFSEGDVQHWWHPPTGRGVRTHISDDLLWLPYVVHHYLQVTDDQALLDEKIPFLTGQAIPPGKEDSYFQPTVAPETASLFEHCARALESRLAVGSHGLPLMGSGDWNDGMNRVGAEGKGESIWLGWFLVANLTQFAAYAEIRKETKRAERWRTHAKEVVAALEKNGWDGDWYRRAYFDDGTPLGTAAASECRLDSIAQSWSVISGAGDPARARLAMASLERHLVRRKEGLVLLFTPPFRETKPSPGYIQGYLPGVRENGGQYTHAAAWAVIAFAALGDGDKAAELFGLLNPIAHGKTQADVDHYNTEPYVVAGDVYSEAPHVGRGGWTWYTGAAGWLYRAGVEWILGFKRRDKSFLMDPCIPKSWPRFSLTYRYHSSHYDITVENPKRVSRGVGQIFLDGKEIPKGNIPLQDDGLRHRVQVVLE